MGTLKKSTILRATERNFLLMYFSTFRLNKILKLTYIFTIFQAYNRQNMVMNFIHNMATEDMQKN